MKPKFTICRLQEPGDFKTCKEIWAQNKQLFGVPKKFGWPTVVAERNGKILGFLSTNPSKKAIVAGPLILGKNCSIIVALRLAEGYENLLRAYGIRGYYFRIQKKNTKWMNIVKKLGYKEMEATRTWLWFYRSIA